MFNRIKEIAKKIEGNVLVIGLNDDLVDAFNKNKKVNLYSISSESSKRLGLINKKSKKKKTNQGKSINIKKLRKYINKKTANYIVLNIEEMYSYYKYIIKDTIYLCNNKIYVYASNNIDKDFIVSRYERYDVTISITDYKNGYIIEIDSTNGNTTYIIDKLYLIKDTFYNVAELIGNILAS